MAWEYVELVNPVLIVVAEFILPLFFATSY